MNKIKTIHIISINYSQKNGSEFVSIKVFLNKHLAEKKVLTKPVTLGNDVENMVNELLIGEKLITNLNCSLQEYCNVNNIDFNHSKIITENKKDLFMVEDSCL